MRRYLVVWKRDEAVGIANVHVIDATCAREAIEQAKKLDRKINPAALSKDDYMANSVIDLQSGWSYFLPKAK
jgi:hypothetical protein